MNLSLLRHARRVVGVIWIALFAVLIAFSLFTHLASLTGRQLFIIGGGSMEPSIPLGSMVIVSSVDPSTIDAGDAVTIRADNGAVVTHRVSRVVDLPEGRFFVLKGDANLDPDLSLVPARAIVGIAGAYVPLAGYAQEYLSTLPGLIAVVTLLGALLLIYFLLELLGRPGRGPAAAQTSIDP
jgi:signal peptidase I